MRFTAEFDTPDTADICAAAIRKNVPDITDLRIKSDIIYNNNNDKGILFSNYTPQVNNPQYSMPLFSHITTRDIDTGMEHDYSRNLPVLEVTSRKEHEKMISNIIVGYGGLNIHKF